MRVAREGYPLILTVAACGVAALAFGWTLFSIVLFLLALAVAGFFRDPERIIPTGENLILAPADGKVVSIAPVTPSGMFAGSATRISIFLSPLDVHINRIPVAGKVSEVRYQRGAFLPAYNEAASERNEQNALEIVDGAGRSLGVVQIAGVMARRIVCWAKVGDDMGRGDRFGLIMFGSRTDTYLPHGCSVEVGEGQRVRGGETIIGRFV
ncbi:MAG TPA: phosphatidylserine decarboxylase family protein [Candidatus Binatia bacterium]|nr:phosphatidylserine decarboxylase family protein [Candidatus Binatia bacterium]